MAPLDLLVPKGHLVLQGLQDLKALLAHRAQKDPLAQQVFLVLLVQLVTKVLLDLLVRQDRKVNQGNKVPRVPQVTMAPLEHQVHLATKAL